MENNNRYTLKPSGSFCYDKNGYEYEQLVWENKGIFLSFIVGEKTGRRMIKRFSQATYRYHTEIV